MQKYDRVDEKPFEAVAALSELTERAYELLARPIVRQLAPEWFAKAAAGIPSAARAALGDLRPQPAASPACRTRRPRSRATRRRPRRADNAMLPVRAVRERRECASAASTSTATCATPRPRRAFFQVYGNMLSLNVADQQRAIRRATRFDPALGSRGAAGARHARGGHGAIEGFVRIALLIAKAGSGKRKLSRWSACASWSRPRACSTRCPRTSSARLMHEETIVVEFEPERAKRALPKLLRSDRRPPARARAARRHRSAPSGSTSASARSSPSCGSCCRCRASALPAPREARGRASATAVHARRAGAHAARGATTATG